MKNQKSRKIKKGKRKIANTTRKQKRGGGECPYKGASFFSGGCGCGARLFSGGKCKKCKNLNRNLPFYGGSNCRAPTESRGGSNCRAPDPTQSQGGGNANLDAVFNTKFAIPPNNHMNDPVSMMRSERLTGGKKSKRNLKKGGVFHMNNNVVSSFGDLYPKGFDTMQRVLSGNNVNDYQPENNQLPPHHIMA